MIKRKVYKPSKYRIFYSKSRWFPSKYIIKGWKKARIRLNWYNQRGIKAYAKKIRRKPYLTNN